WWLARKLVPGIGMTALLAPYYLAISPVLVQHSITGLETSLFALLLAGVVILAAGGSSPPRRALLVGALLLLSLTRPEAPGLALVLLALRWALAGRLSAGPRLAADRRAALLDAAVYAAPF